MSENSNTQNSNPNQGLKDFLAFQQNLKKTSLGLKFANRLFTRPDSLTISQITTTLKVLGLKLPDGVEVAADLAQIISSGAAAYEAYQTADDIGAVANPTAGTMKLYAKFAEEQGWMDDDTAMLVSIGANTAMIIGSGGADVKAWIGLAMDLGKSALKSEMEAKQMAAKGVMNWYKGRISEESQNFVSALGALQKGEVGIFGFLSLAATKGTLIYESAVIKNPAFEKVREMLPGLNFLPIGSFTVQSEASSTTFYGDTKSANYKLKLQGLSSGKLNLSPSEAMEFIFHFAVKPYLQGYYDAEFKFSREGKASIFNAALLMGLEQSFLFGENIAPLLLKHLVSPSEIGEGNIILSMQNIAKSNAIVSSIGQTNDFDLTKAQLIQADQMGRIDLLMRDRDAIAKINQAFSYPKTPFQANVYGDAFKLQDWRNINNFLSVMDFMDLIYSDPLYKKLRPEVITQYESFLPRSAVWQEKLQKLNTLSMTRKVNVLARSNVAYFLNTSPDKVKKISPPLVGEPGFFKAV